MLKRSIIAGLVAAATLTSAHAACDAAKGEKVFIKCKACHATEKGAPNKVGPNLFGVVGRKAGTYAGYNYSPAMKKYGKAWDSAALHAYLEKPMKVVPGTRMTFIGLAKEQDRDDVICYLETKK